MKLRLITGFFQSSDSKGRSGPNCTFLPDGPPGIKSKLILMASVLIPFLHIMFFVSDTGGSTAFRDDMYLIKGAVVEKFCNGTLTFADLWRPTGGSRLLGYNLLLLANTAWCGLRSRPIVLLIPFVLLATAILLYRDYQRSLAGLCSPALFAGSYFLPMFLLFNLTMWEALTFEYAIIFVWSVPWFLASFYALENLVLKGGGYSWLLAILISGTAVLLFGQTSSFAFGASLAITFGCRVVFNRQKLQKERLIRALAGAAVLGLIAFLYLYRIKENDYFPFTQYMNLRIFAHGWNVLRFVLVTLAGSVVGVDAATKYLSSESIVALGSLVAMAYALALTLYFKTRMHERTYLPVFLIAYTLAFIASMTMGRFQYGLWYGMASRYTCSTLCGIIAIVWIYLFAFAKTAVKPLRYTLVGVTILVFAGMCWTSVLEWRTQPYRKETFQRLSEIALRVDTASDEELANFEERPYLVRDSLRVLKRYQLNVYRAALRPLVPSTSLLLSSGGVSSTDTFSSPGIARTGYATLECNKANGLVGTAVVRLVQNNVVISESAVPAARATKAARVFVDYRVGVPAAFAGRSAGLLSINTGIALVNSNPMAAHATYTLHDPSGKILTAGHGIIESGAHFARFIAQLTQVARDFKVPAEWPAGTRMGSLDITADQPLFVTALRQTTNQREEVISTAAPMADIALPLSDSPVLFPQMADGGGYVTALDLLNTSSKVEKGILDFFDDSGSPLPVRQDGSTAGTAHKYSIPPDGIFHFQTDGLSAAVRLGWVRLTPDVGTSAPIGAGVISCSSQGIVVTQYDVPAAAPTTHARIYVDLLGRHRTALALANVSKEEASIALKAFQTDGSTAAGTSRGPLRLRAGGHCTKSVSDLIAKLPVGFSGVLDISSTRPFAALALRSLINERNDLLVTPLPATDFDRTSLLLTMFPQIADGGGYTTELILLNTGPDVTATIRFSGEAGLPWAVVRKSRLPLAR